MSTQTSTGLQHLVSVTDAANQIKADLLGFYAAHATPEMLCAEVVRVALWIQSVYKGTVSLSDATVTTHYLLEQARTLWKPLSRAYQENTAQGNHDQGIHEEIDRDVLDMLTEQGDIFSLKGGKWLPASLRLVPLAQTHYLLVGGMPTRLLPDAFLRNLRLHGSFRYVDGSKFAAYPQHSDLVPLWQFQSLKSWLGPSPPSLSELLQSFEQQELARVSQQHVSDVSFGVYAAYVDAPQYVRWRSLDAVEDGRYLLRSSTPWGMRQYSVGVISNHQLIQQSHLLQQPDIRRLCYALDHKAGRPTKAIWERRSGMLTLKSELPEYERKFLSVIGALEANDRYYPRRWKGIAPEDSGRVQELLTSLGIHITMS